MKRDSAYAAQCLMCQHAQRDTTTATRYGDQGIPPAIGCERFTSGDHSADLADMRDALSKLLYQNAAEHRCPAYQRLAIHRDGFWAVDAPYTSTVDLAAQSLGVDP